MPEGAEPAPAITRVADVAAIVVAAGSGERLGAVRPKAFVELAGTPLLVHAVRACAASPRVGAVVAVVCAGELDEARALLAGAGLAGTGLAGARHGTIVCAGGATRQESVRHGLAACPAGLELVAIHDAARPLLATALLDRVLAGLTGAWDAVAPAVPLADTVKRVEGERVAETLDRATLRAVQTPQAFRREWIERAHAACAGQDLPDDLAVAERAGGRVRLVPGEPRNLKVTYPDDLRVAAALLEGAVRA